MDHPKPRLRYIDASRINDRTLELDDLDVCNEQDEVLGAVDGLVVDSQSGRPIYVVVDAGGWFTAKLFLLPIGEIALDPSKRTLRASIARSQVERFPGFNSSEFETLTDEDIQRVNAAIGEVYEPGASQRDDSYAAAWERNPYRTPDWWDADAGELRALLEADASDTGLRAQPGDVLGIESEGAQTHVGDTVTDERERRRDALADAARVH